MFYTSPKNQPVTSQDYQIESDRKRILSEPIDRIKKMTWMNGVHSGDQKQAKDVLSKLEKIVNRFGKELDYNQKKFVVSTLLKFKPLHIKVWEYNDYLYEVRQFEDELIMPYSRSGIEPDGDV